MATADWRQALNLSLREKVAQGRGTHFEFFSLLRVIECAHSDLPRLGAAASPAQEPLRLRSSPALDFAPTTLQEVSLIAEGRWRVDSRFLSLFGPNGALPLHLSEYAWDRQHNHRDATLARFADVFHHRMLMSFYRAWAQSEPTVSYDRPAGDRFALQLGAIGGYGFASMNGRDRVADNAKRYFAGLLARHTRSAEGGAQILADYYGVACEIEQYAVGWIKLPVDQRTCLGAESPMTCLGVGTVAGDRVPDCQSNYGVRLGPMPLAKYQQFLPGAPAAGSLIDWLRHYFSDAFGWSARVVLQRQEVPRPMVGQNMLLGWQFWLGDYGLERDADDLVLHSPAMESA